MPETGQLVRTGQTRHLALATAEKVDAAIVSAVRRTMRVRPARVVGLGQRRLRLLPGVLGVGAELHQRRAAATRRRLGERARLDRHLVGAELRVLGQLGAR